MKFAILDYSASGTTHQMSDIPAHEAGMRLFWVIAVSAVPTITATGWTAHSTLVPATVNNTRWLVYEKVATSSNEAPPGFTTGATAYSWQVVIAATGIDATTPFDAVATASAAAAFSAQTPPLTTTKANCVVFDFAAFYSSTSTRKPFAAAADMNFLALSTSSRQNGLCGYRIQPTAGSVPQKTIYTRQAAATASHFLSFAVCLASAADTPPTLVKHFDKIVHEVEDTHVLNTTAGVTFKKTYDSITAIGSYPVENGLVASINSPLDTSFRGHTIRFSATVTSGQVWVGGGFAFSTPKNASGKIIKVSFQISNRTRISADGIILTLLSSAGNFAAYQLRAQNSLSDGTYYTAFIDETATVYAASGTLDWSSIAEIHGSFLRTGSNNQTIDFGSIMLIDPADPACIAGGGANDPINAVVLKNIIVGQGGPLNDLGGDDQLILRVPLRICDTSVTSYLDSPGESWSLPRRKLASARVWGWDVGDDKIGIRIKASASDTVKLRQGLLSSRSSRAFFEIDAASSTSAAYDFSEQSFRNIKITWKSGINCSSANFVSCAEVDGKGASFDACTFDQANVSGTSAALKLDAGGSATDCAFAAADASDYAVRLTQAGSNTLDGSTFSASTTPLKVSATTGTTTVHMALGQTAPAYSSDGATVVFDIPTVSALAEVTGAASGSRIRVFNLTTATKLYDAIATSWSLSYQNGDEFTNGDAYRVIVTRETGTDADLPFVYDGLASSTGWSVPVAQEADTVYETHALDGSALTGITWTPSTVDIDLDGSDTTVWWREIYARWVWAFHQSGGEDLLGAAEAIDLANYRFLASVIINVAGTTPVLVGGDGFGRRADGGSLFGTGPLQIDNGVGALAVEVGTSGLTPTESAKLLSLDTDAVNVASLNGAAVIGTGTTGDAWRGVGVVP